MELILAIVPPLALLIYIYKMDKHEKEPIGLLVKTFFFGVISALPAYFGELFMNYVLYGLEGTGILYHLINAIFGVALIEEGVKYLAVRWATWKNKDFNYTFDGIVYAVVSSLGFATIENILYVVDQPYGASSLAFARALTSIPGHTAFGVFMGYYYGLSKLYSVLGDKKKSVKTMWKGMAVSILLHGFYDFCLFTGETAFVVIFYIFIVILDILMFKRVHDSEKQDTPFYREYGVSEGHIRFGEYIPDNSAFENIQYGAGVSEQFSRYTPGSGAQFAREEQYGATPQISAQYGMTRENQKFMPQQSQQQYMPNQQSQQYMPNQQSQQSMPQQGASMPGQGQYVNPQSAPQQAPTPTRYMPPQHRQQVSDIGGEIQWGAQPVPQPQPITQNAVQQASSMPAEPKKSADYYDPDGFYQGGNGTN